MVSVLSGATFWMVWRLDGSVETEGTEIDAGSVRILADTTKAVEFHLNCCLYYRLAWKPNIVD
jgi:hypothetical protein